MTENRPDAGGDGAHRLLVGLLRAGWPLPGALSGATLGFHLYFQQPGLNTDSAAPLLFAGLWALGGLVGGLAIATLAGGLLARALRRALGAGPLLAAGLALLGVIALCLGLQAPLAARLPALLWPAPVKASPSRAPLASPCSQPAPSERRARQAWELECR